MAERYYYSIASGSSGNCGLYMAEDVYKRQILDEALRAGETDTHASLYAVQQSGDQTTLVFMQMYGGVPILGDSDFATFRFTDGVLSSATIRLQRFAARSTRRTRCV